MNIITLTLNPAFDIHCTTDKFTVGKENVAVVLSKDAGGKGINISRALCENGIANKAFAVLGDENASEFCEKLSKSIDLTTLTVNGRIRENITVHVPDAPETRLSFKGFSVDAELFEKVKATLLRITAPGDIITFTGSLPVGMSVEIVKELIKELSARQIKTVIDSNSFSLTDMIECKPFLIKPNEEEISKYLAKEITGFSQITEQAVILKEKGIQNVMVSLGEKGALLVCEAGIFIAVPPSVTAVSTIGAGDSSIAGFLARFVQGGISADCLKTAVAYGTAACLTPGTQPPKPEDINNLITKITLKKI